MEFLVIELPREKPYVFDTTKSVITLGRDDQNDIALRDHNVSRRHAEIVREANGYWMVDLGSTNGTFVNSCRVEKQLLHAGDRIIVGSHELTFRGVEPQDKRLAEETDKEQADGTQSIISCIKLPQKVEANVLDSFELPEGALSAERAFANLKLLFEMTQLFKGVFEAKEILERSMNKVAETMNADEVCLFLYDEKTKGYELVISKTRGPMQHAPGSRVSRTILERATRNLEAVLCHDASLDERFGATESIILKRIRSSVCVPLWNSERVIGAIYLHNTTAASAFSEEDLYFVSILARHIADVLENLELYEQVRQKERIDTELRVAHEIQQRLLPRLFPEDPRIEFSGLNIPAREVGGDFYDVICIAPGTYLVVIGDVAGKGVPAALFMAGIRSIIRSQSIGECDLEALMNKANALIEADSEDGMFITIFCGIIDSNTMTLTFINAGHNPPILYRARRQEFEPLKSTGKPLGILPDSDYRDSTVQLEHGDVVLCYTDGVTEAVSAHEGMFGFERLGEAIQRHVSLSAEELVQHLIEDVDAFGHGVEQRDDLTILAAKMAPARQFIDPN